MPHLDDEFAIAPLIKKLAKKNLKNLRIIYCAERLNLSKRRFEQRRKENKSSLKFLGISPKEIIYLNDFFKIEDLNLYKSEEAIFKFIKNFRIKFEYEQILTLACEGGNPDHDCLSFLIQNLAYQKKIKAFFFPAYNYDWTFFLPFKILKNLNSQNENFNKLNLGRLCWFDSLKVALIYKSERNTFLKLLPLIITHVYFSNYIYYSNQIYFNKVDWNKSLTLRIYKFKLNIIFSLYKKYIEN